MKIKDIPWFNRPGFKLTRHGVNSLDDAELLAIIFGVGSKGESALEISNKILRKYNLNRLEDLGLNKLKKEIGLVNSLKVFSLIELSKRYNKVMGKGFKKVVNSAEDVFNMFKDRFVNEKKEHFIVLYLDVKNRIIKEEVVSVGTLDSSLVHPREVFKSAIRESANSVILVHNHPSGDCSPSENDRNVTEKIMEAGEKLGIKVLDHVIIGDGFYYSFVSDMIL